LRFEYHAGVTAQHYFDSTSLIDAAARAVDVFDADRYSLNGACKLSQRPA
jgi:hypothetical protein